MNGHSHRTTPAYNKIAREESASSMLGTLRWNSEGDLAFARCRSPEHMELVNSQLVDARVRVVTSDADDLVVTVLKGDLQRAFPQALAQRAL